LKIENFENLLKSIPKFHKIDPKPDDDLLIPKPKNYPEHIFPIDELNKKVI